MTVRNVKKNLAGQQDLLPGVGPYEQIRRGQPVTVDGPAKSYFDLFVRSYAEAGLPVKGTFEDGCTLATIDDIAIYLAEGKGYSYSGPLPHTIGAGETPVGNPLWVSKDGEIFRNSFLKGSITEDFLVPSRFPTLQAGVDWLLMNRHPTNNYVASLKIESGHQPASGVTVNNANAGFIFISSADAVVTLSPSFPTTADFIHCENGSAPTLNCLVDAGGRCATGYIVQNNARGKVNPGCGVKNVFGDGLLAKYGAKCNATGSIWTGAAQGGGMNTGILAWAAEISAESSDVSGSLHYGAQSGHGGYLSFRHGMANDCGRYGIRATDMGTVDADGAQASNCGINGVRAFNLGNINARDIIATGCGSNSDTSTANVSASEGSTINVTGGTLTGSKYNGILCVNSTVTATSANLSGAFFMGIDAKAGSKVSLSSAIVTGCGSIGINALGSVVSAVNANCDNSGTYGIMAQGAAIVDAEGATAKACKTGGISSREGSSVNATNADVTGTVSGTGLYALGGSINAQGAKARVGDGTIDTVNDLKIGQGGIIRADVNTVGGVSHAVNTLTANGIIFK